MCLCDVQKLQPKYLKKYSIHTVKTEVHVYKCMNVHKLYLILTQTYLSIGAW